ncbi:MAG: GNAT family N-acetyltransferase [Mycobacteriales bacterium]
MATLRRATPDDAEALTRLRGHMHEAMGAVLTASWQDASVEAFRRRLAGEDFVAYAVEVEGTVVCSGVGSLEEHLPSPGHVDGRRGHISSMSTEPAHRRQGHAREVFSALMAWFGEQGIRRVDLRATGDGQPLYESFGFRALGGVTMAWTAPGTTPGMPGR